MIDLPGQDTFLLRTPPESFEGLVQNIGGRVNQDPQTVKITYTNPEGHRLMINGNARYQEALGEFKGQPLSLSVILVPVATPGIEARLLGRLESGEFLLPVQSTEPTPDQYSSAKSKISEIIENSMHYLSPNFKKSLRILLLSEVLATGQVDLSDCSISSYECFLLSQLLPLLPGTKSLSLKNNLINDEGVSTLCQELPSVPVLEQLDLSKNAITSASVPTLCEGLKSAKELSLVSLSFNQLTQEDFESLFLVLPRKCRIMQHKTEKCSTF